MYDLSDAPGKRRFGVEPVKQPLLENSTACHESQCHFDPVPRVGVVPGFLSGVMSVRGGFVIPLTN
jgi:hypothetical protein